VVVAAGPRISVNWNGFSPACGPAGRICRRNIRTPRPDRVERSPRRRFFLICLSQPTAYLRVCRTLGCRVAQQHGDLFRPKLAILPPGWRSRRGRYCLSIKSTGIGCGIAQREAWAQQVGSVCFSSASDFPEGVCTAHECPLSNRLQGGLVSHSRYFKMVASKDCV
jgi:hypothetical protein